MSSSKRQVPPAFLTARPTLWVCATISTSGFWTPIEANTTVFGSFPPMSIETLSNPHSAWSAYMMTHQFASGVSVTSVPNPGSRVM